MTTDEKTAHLRKLRLARDEIDRARAGRLWDILWMFRCAARRMNGSTLTFRLHVAMHYSQPWQTNEAKPERSAGLSCRTHRLVTLKAVCGPGDDLRPVITIMLPEED